MPEGLDLMIVEDDLDDLRLLQRAIASVHPSLQFICKRDGAELMTYVASGAPAPSLLLLDLNMPRMSGWEVVSALRDRHAWPDVRIVIMTTSRAEHDRNRAQGMQINGFYSKPDSFLALTRLMRELLPHEADNGVGA